MKEYSTMITSEYVNSWTVANGVREYLANALDSPANFEYLIGEDFIEITSKNITLPATIFALGYSKNRDNASAVGTHGEGAVVGMIPLLREGKSLSFHNGGIIWEPYFKYDEDLDLNLLTIKEYPASYTTNDFTVKIGNLQESELQEIVDSCLYLQKDLGEVKEGSRGRIITGIAGKLYVGGLFVCSISGHLYSYDFLPEFLPLNRDRKSVDSWNLATNTTRLLEEVFPAKEVAVMVRDKVRDTGSYYASIKNQDVAEAAYELFKEVSPALTVVCDGYDEQKKLKDRGFKNVEVVYDNNYRQLIQQSVEYQDMVTELEEVLDAPEEEDSRSPIDMMEDWINGTSEFSDKDEESFTKLLDLFKEKGVEWQ